MWWCVFCSLSLSRATPILNETVADRVPRACVCCQVFGLLGATATSLCCYVMPGLLYVKAANLPWASKEAFLPLCLVTGGTYVCPVLLLRCELAHENKTNTGCAGSSRRWSSSSTCLRTPDNWSRQYTTRDHVTVPTHTTSLLSQILSIGSLLLSVSVHALICTVRFLLSSWVVVGLGPGSILLRVSTSRAIVGGRRPRWVVSARARVLPTPAAPLWSDPLSRLC